MIPIRKQMQKAIEDQEQMFEKNEFVDSKKSKSEIVKIILQTLEQFGLNETAAALVVESGIELESKPMKKFKALVQKKQWKRSSEICEKLPFQDVSSVKKCKYMLFRHAYFECLIKKQTEQAVQLLQNELKLYAPSNQELKALTALVIISSPDELIQSFIKVIYDSSCNFNQKLIADQFLKGQQKPANQSSAALKFLHQSTTYITQSVQTLFKPSGRIPPPKLLQKIVKQAKSYEVLRCPVHSSLSQGFSIADTHICQARGYPNKLASRQRKHSDEVWHAQFSPTGLLAVTICKKSSIVLWKLTENATSKQQLPENNKNKVQKGNSGYRKPVNVKLQFIARHDMEDSSLVWCFAWNDKGDKIAISQENKILTVWDINPNAKDDIDISGNTTNSNGNPKSIVRSALLRNSKVESMSLAFIPNKSLILYAYETECIFLWDYISETVDKIICNYSNLLLHLLPNSKDLVSVSSQGRISIINLATKEEMSFFEEKDQIICSVLPKDGNHLLINTISPNSLKLWNLSKRELDNTFLGYQQTNCLLRPSMKDNYIAIGKADYFLPFKE